MLMNGYVPFSSEEDFFMRRNKNCDSHSQTGFDSYSYLDRNTTALPALLVLMGVQRDVKIRPLRQFDESEERCDDQTFKIV